MLCDDVKRSVYFFLDGALAEPRQHDFNEHINLCPDCQRRTQIHRRLRVFIIKRLSPEKAPSRLRQRLTRAFRAMTGGWA